MSSELGSHEYKPPPDYEPFEMCLRMLAQGLYSEFYGIYCIKTDIFCAQIKTIANHSFL